MTPLVAPALSETAAVLCAFSLFLAACAPAGLALINAGLGRSRNVAHSLMSSLCAAAVAGIAYFAIGYAWLGYAGEAAHTVSAGGKAWNWLGAGSILLRGVKFDGSAPSLAAVFGFMAVLMAALIPLGAGAERWRLRSICASTAIFAGIVWPVFAHWIWGGGWLAQLAPGLLDCGGAGAIQAAGGVTALAITWLLGPRRGKFHEEGMPTAIPAHSGAFVLFGCFVVWLGFLALDCAGAILFAGAGFGRAMVIPVNATLSAGAALLAGCAITQTRFGKPDASLCANAWVGGLVAGSAGCAAVAPLAAVVIGLVGGALVVFSVEWLELHWKVDDPGGAVSVHALGGIWGLLAAGLFGGPSGQWLTQLVGIATVLGFVLPAAYGANWLLDRFLHMRVEPEGERRGMDLHELGAGAYPDFATYGDD